MQPAIWKPEVTLSPQEGVITFFRTIFPLRLPRGIFRLGRLWLLDILRRARNAGALLRCLPFRRQGTTWRFAVRF